jgi:hypothetical protein
MSHNPLLVDEKNNLVFITIFESHLAKFVLDNPQFYQDAYQKILHGLQHVLTQPNDKIKKFIETRGPTYDLKRHIFLIFSRLGEAYPTYDSFDKIYRRFNLCVADYLIKLLADDIFIPIADSSPKKSSIPAHVSLFFNPTEGRRSPSNALRNPLLFHESNRGVIEISEEKQSTLELETCAFGIVSDAYRPDEFSQYFDCPIEPAGGFYMPNEDSYVALWLRRHHCPVISGASGSTELLISRIFPLIDGLTLEDQKMVIFAQACNMIANGHHSFFEAMLVADSLGYKLSEKPTLKELYLQCIPEPILHSNLFANWMSDESINELPLNLPIEEEKEFLSSRSSSSSPSFCYHTP